MYTVVIEYLDKKGNPKTENLETDAYIEPYSVDMFNYMYNQIKNPYRSVIKDFSQLLDFDCFSDEDIEED